MSETLAWSLPEDLAELLREDPETVQSILETFIEQTRLNLAHVGELAATGSADELSRAVHRLKGGLSQMGAMEASRLCRDFEIAVSGETREQWSSRAEEVREACEAALAPAEKLLHEIC